MDPKNSKLPDKLLNEIEENCSSFALFYYDFNGNPVLYTFYPTTKDKMAMMTFMGEYLGQQPSMIGRDPTDLDTPEGGESEENG